jgi:hypothetical protein
MVQLLDRKTLKGKSIRGAEVTLLNDIEQGNNNLKQMQLNAKTLFETEYPIVVNEIEKRTQKGYTNYSHPILAHSWDRDIWENNWIREDGSKRIDRHSKLRDLTLSNIYKEDIAGLGYILRSKGKDVKDLPTDKDTKDWVIASLVARQIARKCLLAKLDVSHGKMISVTTWSFQKSRNYKSSHHELDCLFISWR